jgi:hypothetical protein
MTFIENALVWFVIIIRLIEVGTGFAITALTWEVDTINGIAVVIYGNLISVAFSIAGPLIIYLLARFIKVRRHKRSQS